MRFCDPAANSKAEACAARGSFEIGPRFFDSKEAFENAWLKIRRDAWAVIGNTDGIKGIGTRAGNEDSAAGGRVFDCVIEQIHEHSAEERFVSGDEEFRGSFALQGDLFRLSKRAEIAYRVCGKLIQIEFRECKRILPDIGTSQREEVFDNLAETNCFLAQDFQRFAVLTGSAVGFGKGDFGFAAEYCYGRAQLVRGISDKAALMFEGFVEAIQKLIKGLGEVAQFVFRVANDKPVVEIFRADASSLTAHGDDGRQTAPGKKIPTESCEQNGKRDQQSI